LPDFSRFLVEKPRLWSWVTWEIGLVEALEEPWPSESTAPIPFVPLSAPCLSWPSTCQDFRLTLIDSRKQL
jgi:hypothetical protein